MQVLLIFALLGAVLSSRPHGIDFVGVGYNLLKGNPDGGDLNKGGVDPGINLIRNILHVSSKDKPEQVIYVDRRSCSTTNKTYIFYGTKSYQEKLGGGLDLEGDGNKDLAKFSFGLSAGFKSAKAEFSKDKKIYQDFQHICNKGSARFADELASSKHYSVSENFAAAACSLPHKYDTKAYMKFLDDWGTHVIMEVDLGTKTTIRHVSSLSQFLKQVQKSGGFNLSFLGSYLGFGASLGLDFHKFQSSKTFQETFGRFHSKIVLGDASHSEPIHLKLKTVASMFNHIYWQAHSASSQCHDSKSMLPGKKANVLKALDAYAHYKLVTPSTDQQLRIPITWPAGTYGVAETGTSCPAGRVTWNVGTKAFISKRANAPLSGSHISLDQLFEAVSLQFCMKGHPQYSEYDSDWPGGDYCIYKYQQCPPGFRSGSIFWDDLHVSDDRYSRSGGSLPDGDYGRSTRIYFCCRNDKLPTDKIYLPTEKPFGLFKYQRECQQVFGMTVREQRVQWRTFYMSHHTSNHDSAEGSHPYDDGGFTGHILHLCVYYKAGTQLIG